MYAGILPGDLVVLKDPRTWPPIYIDYTGYGRGAMWQLEDGGGSSGAVVGYLQQKVAGIVVKIDRFIGGDMALIVSADCVIGWIWLAMIERCDR